MPNISKKSMYKLLAADLDGTLVNEEKIITPRTFESLMEAQRRGVRLAISTGRPVEGARHLVEQLRLKEFGGCLISYNGALVHDCATSDVIFSQPINTALLPLLLRRAEEHSCAFVVYQPTHVLTTDASSQYVQYSGRNNRLPVHEAEDFLGEARGALYKGLLVGDPDIMPALRDTLTEELRGQMDFCLSETFFLECLAPGISKMKGLEAVAGHMNIKREEIMAFGDSDNDVSMIRWAGLGVAMGNAKENARRAADLITGSNEDDGIAAVVEQYVL